MQKRVLLNRCVLLIGFDNPLAGIDELTCTWSFDSSSFKLFFELVNVIVSFGRNFLCTPPRPNKLGERRGALHVVKVNKFEVLGAYCNESERYRESHAIRDDNDPGFLPFFWCRQWHMPYRVRRTNVSFFAYGLYY